MLLIAVNVATEADVTGDEAQIAAAEVEGMPAPADAPPRVFATPVRTRRLSGVVRSAGLFVAASVVAGLALPVLGSFCDRCGASRQRRKPARHHTL
jgi:hypothetical protein